MSPDPRDRSRRSRKSSKRHQPSPRFRPSSDDAHDVKFFKRHPQDDPNESEPGRDLLNSWPMKVRATMRAVLSEVAASPPKRFSGGGYWEAMKGTMTGWYEVRVDGPRKQTHYRLYCLLDYDGMGAAKPYLTVICGASKPVRTVLSDSTYRHIRDLGDEYLARNPRSIV